MEPALASIAVLNYDVVASAVLLAFAFLSLREMLGRWRKDLEELRTTDDRTLRFVVVALWGATALIAFLAIRSVSQLIGSVAHIV